MTISEMHVIVEQECFHIDGLHSQWIDIVLNSAINQFVRDKFTMKGNDKLDGLDDSSLRSSDLQVLIANQAYTTGVAVPPVLPITSNYCSLPSTYLYPISLSATINYTLTNRPATANDPTKEVPVIITDNEKIYKFFKNPLKNNPEEGILATIDGGKIYYFPDKRSIVVYSNLTYLKKPAVVNVNSQPNINCDLPDHTHDEIVQMAIAKLLEKSENPRYQTKLVDNKMID